MLGHFGRGFADIGIGWCTGARVLLHCVASNPSAFGTAVLLNSAYEFPDVPRTRYQRDLEPVLKNCLQNPKLAEFFCSMMADLAKQPDGVAAKFLLQRDPRLLPLTSEPFRDAEALVRYAMLCCAQDGIDDLDVAARVSVPTLVVSCVNDHVAHGDASRTIAAALPEGQFARLEGCDHYVGFIAPHPSSS